MNDIQTTAENTVTYTQAERNFLMEMRTRLGSGVDCNTIAGVDTFESFVTKQLRRMSYVGWMAAIIACITIILSLAGLVVWYVSVWRSYKKIKLTHSLCEKRRQELRAKGISE